MNITDDQLKQRDAVSDTPRTDADYALHGGSVCPEFARILERELAAVTADLEFRRDLGALQQQEYDKVTAERDVLKADLCAFVAFAVDMERQLSAVTAERDRLRDTKWEGITKLESDLAASQQEARRLREALEKCIACLDWFAHNKPDDMGADDEAAMKLAAAALTSTPAPVHSDTERLDYALEHSKWLSETFFMSTWQFEETKTRMREKIDAELAKEGK